MEFQQTPSLPPVNNQPPPPSIVPPPSTPILPKEPKGLRGYGSTILLLIAAPIIALCITSFVFQSYEVFGPSMQSTLQSGDRLIVNKLPVTLSKITREPFIPKRGEIVVFQKRDILLDSTTGNKQLIKRIIALPGERVVVKDGVLTVYNSERPGGFQPDKEGGYLDTGMLTAADTDVIVGEEEVFVCGDNRPNSLDSRSFGPIKTSDIVGTATFRFLPVNKVQRF